ncbi:DUF1285 domain-containing protein, partial [Alphaproteobacteria bacterium]|nr:DUF1285 domain-containing protein [Alphaproteobacteria bacterium]
TQECGHLNIRISRNGTWYYQNSPINRLSIIKLFSKVIRLDADGKYYLITPVEKGLIDVEDVPFVINSMKIEESENIQKIKLVTNVDDKVVVSKDNPIRVLIDKDTGEPSPYVLIRDNLEALISRSIYYDLVDISVESKIEKNLWGVWSQKTFFPLGKVVD